ncbi:hypothetical protein SAMN05518668_11646 [Sphingobium sp. YR657]|jgi:hypothetical protein|nr:hypothetical protein SAMN05518668_11646 [Sphingobium sp. YR657]
MREMLSCRRDKVGAYKPAIWCRGVQRKNATILSINAGTPLVGEIRSSRDRAVFLSLAYPRKHRLGECDSEGGIAIYRDWRGKRRGVAPGDGAVVRGFVK